MATRWSGPGIVRGYELQFGHFLDHYLRGLKNYDISARHIANAEADIMSEVSAYQKQHVVWPAFAMNEGIVAQVGQRRKFLL